MKTLIYMALFLGFIGIIMIGSLYMFNTYKQDMGGAASGGMMQDLVMPGLLSDAHREYENQCSKCHASFSKKTQNSLCLDCHEDTAKDIDASSGFHGRFSSVKEAQCKSCHTDHEGRGFDIVRLEKEIFRHDLTDFELSGAHDSPDVSCSACHKEGKKFREAPSSCFDCHQADDDHKGKLGQDCASCHTSVSWKDTYFDHAETEFPLFGQHQKVTCEACHADKSFKDTPRDCVSCHKADDVHKSPVTQKCSQCHSEESWNAKEFNHRQETDFSLKGRHDTLSCEACHQDLKFSENKDASCNDCHGEDDLHKGANGPRCDQCHSNTSWETVSFDHDIDTDFKLRGMHSNVGCASCHKDGSSNKNTGTSCYSCHKSDDVHSGKLGTSCSECHNEKSWLDDIAFDHDLSSFPLIGIHAVTDCEECHLTSSFRGTKSSCASCHQADDYHKQSLGSNCAECHNPNSWSLWQFNHNTQTEFKLDGSHEGLSCQECHTGQGAGSGRVSASNGCYDCHKTDDVHRGKFGLAGRRCDLCHGSDSFELRDKKQIRFFHDNADSMRVDLIGNCADCHETDDIHNGDFGRRCDRCHAVDSFKNIKIRK